jgi:tetratricopeptide (TPR) repeat protein
MTMWAMALEHKDMAESEKIYRRVLPSMRTEQRRGTIKAQDLAQALVNFGYLRRTQGDSREAEALFREALALSSDLPGVQYFLIGMTRSTLASTLADQGKFEAALQTAREGVADYRRAGRTDAPDYGFSLTILGGFLTDRGDYAEADAALGEAEAVLRRRQSSSSLWLGDNLRNQAISLYRQGRYAESQDRITETEKIYLGSYGPSYDQYPTVLIFKGLILDKTGRSQEGERILREALRLRVESLPAEHFWVAVAKGALGECLTTQNAIRKPNHSLTKATPRSTNGWAHTTRALRKRLGGWRAFMRLGASRNRQRSIAPPSENHHPQQNSVQPDSEPSSLLWLCSMRRDFVDGFRHGEPHDRCRVIPQFIQSRHGCRRITAQLT